MWRQRSPCTRGWPATLLMNSCTRRGEIIFLRRVKINFGPKYLRDLRIIKYLLIYSSGTKIQNEQRYFFLIKYLETNSTLLNELLLKDACSIRIILIKNLVTVVVFEERQLFCNGFARQVRHVDLDSPCNLGESLK